jgi:hypothetical protein
VPVPPDSSPSHSLKYEENDQKDWKPDQEAGRFVEVTSKKFIYGKNNYKKGEKRRAAPVN